MRDLAAASLVFLLAAASPTSGGTSCDERSFTADDATLRPGRAVGTGAISVFGDRVDCPEAGAACPHAAAIMPGQALLLGKARSACICAAFADGLEARTGWVPQTLIATATRPVDPAPPLAAWVGTWRQFDDKIVLTRDGDRLRADGAAYWPGKSLMPANEDAFDGTAAPSGRRVQFGGDADPCMVVLTLTGDFLFARDKRLCGGHNASFNGIYVRQPEGRE